MAFIVAAHRSADTRAIVRSVLEEAGHTVVLFSDGAHALAEITAGMPDAVVLDDRLGGMSGLEVRSALRACPVVAGIRVVVCSATLSPAEIYALQADGDVAVRPSMITAELRTGVDRALAAGMPLAGAIR